jgi:hypothetical protein
MSGRLDIASLQVAMSRNFVSEIPSTYGASALMSHACDAATTVTGPSVRIGYTPVSTVS